MKSIFDKPTRDELIDRIRTVREDSGPQWGKMNVSQMLRHCILSDEMYLGKVVYKRKFLGRIFGKIALKGFIKDETPIKRNLPSLPECIVKEVHGDPPTEKAKWISIVEEYALFSQPYSLHPFFGKMTKEQLGPFVYKHIDHHLRQFNS
jgi:hypothetical protein